MGTNTVSTALSTPYPFHCSSTKLFLSEWLPDLLSLLLRFIPITGVGVGGQVQSHGTCSVKCTQKVRVYTRSQVDYKPLLVTEIIAAIC